MSAMLIYMLLSIKIKCKSSIVNQDKIKDNIVNKSKNQHVLQNTQKQGGNFLYTLLFWRDPGVVGNKTTHASVGMNISFSFSSFSCFKCHF